MDVGIRFQILQQAQQHVYDRYHSAVDQERTASHADARSPKAVRAPSVRKILSTAERFLAFVDPGTKF